MSFATCAQFCGAQSAKCSRHAAEFRKLRGGLACCLAVRPVSHNCLHVCSRSGTPTNCLQHTFARKSCHNCCRARVCSPHWLLVNRSNVAQPGLISGASAIVNRHCTSTRRVACQQALHVEQIVAVMVSRHLAHYLTPHRSTAFEAEHRLNALARPSPSARASTAVAGCSLPPRWS